MYFGVFCADDRQWQGRLDFRPFLVLGILCNVLVCLALRCGPAADTILEFAQRHTIDLVAMTTHDRTGLRRWLYGSVTHKVLDRLPVSMLVVRSAEARLA